MESGNSSRKNEMTNEAIKIISNENGNVTAQFFGGKTITGNSIEAFMPYLKRTHKVIKGMKVVGISIPESTLNALNEALQE